MPQGYNTDKPFDTCGFTTHAEVAADRARCEREWRPNPWGHTYGDVFKNEAAPLGPHGRAMIGAHLR